MYSDVKLVLASKQTKKQRTGYLICCLGFYSYGLYPDMGYCFWVCSLRSFLLLCELNRTNRPNRETGNGSGAGSAVCLSAHQYPQVVERFHLSCFNVPLCLHSTGMLLAKHFITRTGNIDYNNVRNVYCFQGEQILTLKHCSSLQTQIKDFLQE